MPDLKKLLLSLSLLFTTALVMAQNGSDDEISLMRSNSKIYVVVAIVVTILLGLIFYVIRLDRKISRIEKDKP